eukprot:4673581-Pleurochrysis_carterae.AAC.1
MPKTTQNEQVKHSTSLFQDVVCRTFLFQLTVGAAKWAATCGRNASSVSCAYRSTICSWYEQCMP